MGVAEQQIPDRGHREADRDEHSRTAAGEPCDREADPYRATEDGHQLHGDLVRGLTGHRRSLSPAQGIEERAELPVGLVELGGRVGAGHDTGPGEEPGLVAA